MADELKASISELTTTGELDAVAFADEFDDGVVALAAGVAESAGVEFEDWAGAGLSVEASAAVELSSLSLCLIFVIS